MKNSYHFILSFFLVFFSYSIASAQLSGTYVINQSGGGDFTSLGAAAQALNSQGMSGNVNLRLANGVYAEQTMFEIPGQTENRMLTIESVSGNEDDVVFRFEEAESDANYQLAFREVKALTIRNITINTSDAQNGLGIYFVGLCRNILIDNLNHKGNRNDPAISASKLIDFFDPVHPIHNLTVTNSHFFECSPSIDIGTLWTEPEDGNPSNVTVTNNTFFDADGVNFSLIDKVVVKNNLAYGSQYLVQPVKLYSCTNVSITENIMHHTFNTVFIQNCEGTADEPILVANNFISGRDGVLALFNNDYLLFAHNSVYGNASDLILTHLENENSRFINNIFYQNHTDGGIFPLYSPESYVAEFDYNCLYSNGHYGFNVGEMGAEYFDYDEYKDQTNREANGISVQPHFVIPGEDLHVENQALNQGLPLSKVTTDIDGELRDANNPTMGADEMDGVAISIDLTIDTVITSGNLNGGEQLAIEWSGRNMGNIDFNPPWIDRIFLSDDEVLDDGDQALYNYQVQNALPPFESYNRQQLITLDLALEGTKYIIVKIDADVNLVEDNTNNIAVSAPFTVTPPDLPNLVVTDINMPANVYSGTQLQVDFTVTNMGDAPASGEWTELIWFEDYIQNFNQEVGMYKLLHSPIAKVNNIIGLMPGESYQGTAIFETPYIAQGYRYIRVETDGYDDVVEEVDGNDNFTGAMIDSVFVNQSPLADLVVQDIQTPTESFAGEEVTISFTVKNIGTETTSPVGLPYNFYYGWTWGALFGDWVDYTYLSDSTFSFAPGEYERVFTREGNVKVDSSYVVTQTLQMPGCTSGEYFVSIYTDRWNHVAELVEDNNVTISDPIQIIARPAPDLIASSDDPLIGMASNSSHTLTYKVENLGADTAFSGWRDRVFLSQSDTFSFDINEMQADSIRSVTIVPNASANFEIEFDIPPNIYGDVYLYLWIDAINDVCEYPNDDNNILKIPVYIEQSPSADLEVFFTPPANSVVAGDALELITTVTNVGDAVPNMPNWTDRIYLIDEQGSAGDSTYSENYFHQGGLTVDAMYYLPDPFEIPLDIPPGFYRIGAMTDLHGEVWENESEENNVMVSNVFQITIDSSRAPDLKPTDLVNQNWSTGVDYTVEVKVSNDGEPIGLATWVDELVLTDTLGGKLASSTAVFSDGLNSGGEYTATFHIQIPTGTPSNAVFVARIDTSHAVFEYQTKNNIRKFPIDINVGPTPDFSPTDLQVPQFVNAGQELTLSVLRNNFGEVGVENKYWIDRVLLSADDVPDDNDYVLRSYAQLDRDMPAEYSESFTDSIQIPLTRVGTYYVIYFMDADDHIAEGNFEGNNYVVSEQPLEITVPLPVDFSSELVEIDIVDGNPEWIKYSIKNTSSNTFEGKFYNTWYLSTDAEYSSDDKLLGLDQVADYDVFNSSVNLGPGESRTERANFIYVPVVAGDYYIIQKIDAFLNVYETDESNNIVAFGPFAVDNIPEIFPDITYEKQFGRNSYSFLDVFFGYAVSGIILDDSGNPGMDDHGFFQAKNSPNYDSGFDPSPDRHDYKIQIPDGFGMITRMWENKEENVQYGISNESQPIYEMYVGEEYVPTPLNFDFRFDKPMQADQTIIVPVAGERMDYIKTAAPYIPPHFDPVMVPVSNYFLRAEFKEFSVYSMHPEKVGTSHNVTLRITGFDLVDTIGLDVALILGTDTAYAFETYPQNQSELVAYIDMRNYNPGNYELMVRKKTSGDYTIWEETVEVFEDDAALLFTKIQAPSISRSSQDFQIGVTYGNEGYSNLYDMLVFVAVFMDDSTSAGLDVEYLGSAYPGYHGTGFISDEPNPTGPIVLGVLDNMVIYGAYVPIVHARSEETFYFTINGDQPGIITVQATLGLVQRSPYTFAGRTADAGTSRYAVMLGRAIGSATGILEDFAKSAGCDQILNADAMTERLANQTYKVAQKARGASGMEKSVKNNIKTAVDHDAGIKARYDAFKGLIEDSNKLSLTANDDTPFFSELNDMFKCMNHEEPGSVKIKPNQEKCRQTATWTRDGVDFTVRMNMTGGIASCPTPPDPSQKHLPKYNVPIENQNSKDPNEIIGPRGVGPARLVDNDQSFEYTVFFENTPEASAPAARVRIDNPLDENLRVASFRISSFGFADTSFQFNSLPFIQQTIDLGSKYHGSQLKVIGGTYPDNQKAFFEFTTIDPETQAIVTGANEGFLLPNDSTGRGQGYVTYIIEPVRDLDPGTEIKNKAAIIFDGNEIIETNTWTNIISGGELASRVLDLPQFSSEVFQVDWKNETPRFGPPVESFDVYVREVAEDAVWTKWLDGVKSFKKRFEGTPGHTYEFYSRARSERMFETVNGTPEARTTILEFGGDVSDGKPMVFPNPAIGSTTLAYLSPGPGAPMRVDITDVRGKKVSSSKFSATGTGVQYFSIPLRMPAAGVYVVTLYHDGNRMGSTKLVTVGNKKE